MAVQDRDAKARAQMLSALAAGETVTAAARGAGIGRSTVYMWRQRGDPEIDAALKARAALRGPGTRMDLAPPTPRGGPNPRGPDLRAEAVETLRAIHRDPNAGRVVRVQAAKAILSSVPIEVLAVVEDAELRVVSGGLADPPTSTPEERAALAKRLFG